MSTGNPPAGGFSGGQPAGDSLQTYVERHHPAMHPFAGMTLVSTLALALAVTAWRLGPQSQALALTLLASGMGLASGYATSGST